MKPSPTSSPHSPDTTSQLIPFETTPLWGTAEQSWTWLQKGSRWLFLAKENLRGINSFSAKIMLTWKQCPRKRGGNNKKDKCFWLKLFSTFSCNSSGTRSSGKQSSSLPGATVWVTVQMLNIPDHFQKVPHHRSKKHCPSYQGTN